MAEIAQWDAFQIGKDSTRYRLLTREHVSVTRFDGEEVLKIDPEGLAVLAREALRDASFLLRTEHLEQVAAILVLPFCQDTGTATVMAKKGQRVWTGGRDEEFLTRGIHDTYAKENL